MRLRHPTVALLTLATIPSLVGAQGGRIRVDVAGQSLLSTYSAAGLSDTLTGGIGITNGSKARIGLELTARWQYLGIALRDAEAGEFPSKWAFTKTFTYDNTEVSVLLGSEHLSLQVGYGYARLLRSSPSVNAVNASYYPVGMRFSIPLAANRLEVGGVVLSYVGLRNTQTPPPEVSFNGQNLNGEGISAETSLTYSLPGAPLHLFAGYRFEQVTVRIPVGSDAARLIAFIYSVRLGAGTRITL
jgi:hypothetical protein